MALRSEDNIINVIKFELATMLLNNIEMWLGKRTSVSDSHIRSEHRRIRLVNSPSFKNTKVKRKSNQQTLLHNSTTNTPQHTYTLLLLTHHPTSFLTQIYPPPSRPISSPTLPSAPLLPFLLLLYSTRKQLSYHLTYIINRTPLYQNGIKKYRASLLLPPMLSC